MPNAVPDVLRVAVYASERKADTYVYMPEAGALDELPDTLQGLLGALRPVITLELTADKVLARTNGAELLQKIADDGYYLQLPPGPNDLTQGQVRDVDA